MAGSASIAALFPQRVIVGVGELAVSNNAELVVSTYALGSCVALVAYSPERVVGGILHLMLPDSKISPAKAQAQPAMFADTGLPYFFSELQAFGIFAPGLAVFLAGGASVIGGNDPFRIGERNRAAVAAFLRPLGVRVVGEALGGTINRTLHLNLGAGTLTVKTPSGSEQHAMADPQAIGTQALRLARR